MRDYSEVERWVALSFRPGFSGRKLRKCLDFTPDPTQLLCDAGLARRLIPEESEPPSEKRLLERAARELARLTSLRGEAIPYSDTRYPELLRNIPDPPPVLYAIGRTELLNSTALAVVGTRYPTPYGLDITRRFCAELAPHVTIVSGLALGIDTRAHETVLEHHGNTIAVLGCGLDQRYPVSNLDLRKKLQVSGLIITEFPLGTKPLPGRFPRRNRLISGLSFGTLIIEARKGSGALITVNHALDQGREVFAVPGAVTSPASFGPLQLIQQGATPVMTGKDILEFLPRFAAQNIQSDAIFRSEPAVPVDELTADQRKLWEILQISPVPIDTLIVQSNLDVSRIYSILLEFEMNGWIRTHPGKKYSRRTRIDTTIKRNISRNYE